MNKYKYIHFNQETGRIADGEDHKKVIIWSLESPGADYENVTTETELIIHASERYPQREFIGKQFSWYMDGRLIVLGEMITDINLSEEVRGHLDDLFDRARSQVSKGRWISARREINKVVPNADLQNLIDTYLLPLNQENLIQEVKDVINLRISELY